MHASTRRPSPRPFALLSLALATLACHASGDKDDGVPEGFELIYTQDFEGDFAADDFVVSDPGAWRAVRARGDGRLELHGESDYQPVHRSPRSMAVLVGPVVGSFVLEADVLQSGRDYGHRDLCLFFGIQDPEHYYYAHLATQADESAHQIFIVDGAARRPVTSARSFGVDWGRDTWHRVRVLRDLTSEHVVVYFDEDPNPVLRARDSTFGAGWIGFGSFDDTGSFDNVRLYAADYEVESPAFFSQLEGDR